MLNEAQYGVGLRCFNSTPKLQINRSGKLSIGKNVTFNSYTGHSWNSNCKLLVLKDAKLSIGNDSGMNGVMVYCSKKVTIGDNVKIGGGTRISDSNHHLSIISNDGMLSKMLQMRCHRLLQLVMMFLLVLIAI